MIAKRLKKFDSSAIRNAFEMASEIPDPVDLSIGYPEDNTPDYIKSAGIAAIKENYTRYTPSNGMFELREAIAEKLQRENKVKTSSGAVTITPGVTTGILLAYLAVLDPGDEVLLPDPYFPPYRDLAVMIGAKPVLINTFPDFQLTAEQVRAKITKKTKLLVINSPNNPSGAIYSEKNLRAIAAVAKEHNILVISDEIYEHFCYEEKHFSIGSVYANTLTLNGFSKAYAMTGWRVGYISGPQIVIDAINELQQYIVFSTSSIGQKAAVGAFRHSPERLTTKYHAKRDLAVGLLSEKFDISGAQGAFYCFIKVPSGYTETEFVQEASKKGVIILPGSAFSSRRDYVRIAFAADKETIKKGLSLILQIEPKATKQQKKKFLGLLG